MVEEENFLNLTFDKHLEKDQVSSFDQGYVKRLTGEMGLVGQPLRIWVAQDMKMSEIGSCSVVGCLFRHSFISRSLPPNQSHAWASTQF
jgi:hypothetical protein